MQDCRLTSSKYSRLFNTLADDTWNHGNCGCLADILIKSNVERDSERVAVNSKLQPFKQKHLLVIFVVNNFALIVVGNNQVAVSKLQWK
jgi:hypothetical protein